jgi:folate-binding protein YgfZ
MALSTPFDTYGFYPLPNPSCIEISGLDATKVVNNLCTADIASLPVNHCSEGFITDGKGWIVAHVMIVKESNRVLLLGSHLRPEEIRQHIDRYIIREDAVVTIWSQTSSLVVVAGETSAQWISQHFNSELPSGNAAAIGTLDNEIFVAVRCSILGPDSWLCGIQNSAPADTASKLLQLGLRQLTESEFDRGRIEAFWPLHGIDFHEKTIPQELDRDRLAISFTKGCYLGQETIARLDARGQLQKKLSLIQILGTQEIAVGQELVLDEKKVGEITSIAGNSSNNQRFALAFLKRGAYLPGTELQCKMSPALVVENSC